ncbi:protein tyrosine phosphatase family protein [Phormidesmis sp. 146-12]
MSGQIEEIFNFLKLSDRLATAGQPTEAQFPAIAQAGYQVVINLAVPESTNAIAHEPAIVQSLGMEYVHIPVIWTEPTLDDLDRFFTILNTNAEKPIFVHCAMNMRVSAFMYLYRRINDHMSHEAASQDLYQIWTPNDDWQEFIQQAIEHYQAQNLNQ